VALGGNPRNLLTRRLRIGITSRWPWRASLLFPRPGSNSLLCLAESTARERLYDGLRTRVFYGGPISIREFKLARNVRNVSAGGADHVSSGFACPTRSVIVRRPQCEFRRLHRSTFCHHFVAVLAGTLISPRVRSARIAEFA
jgi:hypothetical protein